MGQDSHRTAEPGGWPRWIPNRRPVITQLAHLESERRAKRIPAVLPFRRDLRVGRIGQRLLNGDPTMNQPGSEEELVTILVSFPRNPTGALNLSYFGLN